MFLLMFYKLRACSNNERGADFLFKRPLDTSHTLHSMLFASTLSRVSGQLPPRKIANQLGLGFWLELGLGLRLGGNFSRGQLS